MKLETLGTEQINPAWSDLDRRSSLAIAEIINTEDAKVARAVERALPEIARAIDWISEALENGGRLIYAGTGTSGRIAALDASECPPTFDVPPTTVQFVMAGGERALARAVEADEDSRALGVRELRKRKPGKKDVVVGIAASGRTPFTVAAVEFARQAGSKTIALTSNRGSALAEAAELAIVVETGPEVVAGSTRMKAGTAEKMVLNMLTTGAMVRLGYVYGNLMVNLHQKNLKLTERALTIVENALGLNRDQARKALSRAANDVPVAIVMGKTGASRKLAERSLEAAKGHVRRAIARAEAFKNSDRKGRART
ncbi:MAG: N-acetylmuramic acid 6-phosphate etherase [Acidobacteria bacterium]|nr:N-acetylmuramic acid 6-phosphate etherase [Acidobacteriota bacterium]